MGDVDKRLLPKKVKMFNRLYDCLQLSDVQSSRFCILIKKNNYSQSFPDTIKYNPYNWICLLPIKLHLFTV